MKIFLLLQAKNQTLAQQPAVIQFGNHRTSWMETFSSALGALPGTARRGAITRRHRWAGKPGERANTQRTQLLTVKEVRTPPPQPLQPDVKTPALPSPGTLITHPDTVLLLHTEVSFSPAVLSGSSARWKTSAQRQVCKALVRHHSLLDAEHPGAHLAPRVAENVPVYLSCL